MRDPKIQIRFQGIEGDKGRRRRDRVPERSAARNAFEQLREIELRVAATLTSPEVGVCRKFLPVYIRVYRVDHGRAIPKINFTAFVSLARSSAHSWQDLSRVFRLYRRFDVSPAREFTGIYANSLASASLIFDLAANIRISLLYLVASFPFPFILLDLISSIFLPSRIFAQRCFAFVFANASTASASDEAPSLLCPFILGAISPRDLSFIPPVFPTRCKLLVNPSIQYPFPEYPERRSRTRSRISTWRRFCPNFGMPSRYERRHLSSASV